MKNAIQKIRHKKFGEVRIVVLNGAIYFVGKDAAHALEYRDTSKAVRVHVQPQDKIVFRPGETSGQFQNVGGVKIAHNAILINESGLWSLVMRSNMPQAREFQHWLTSEVIPSIMNNGYYISPAAKTLQSEPQKIFLCTYEKITWLLRISELTNNEVLRENCLKTAYELLN